MAQPERTAPARAAPSTSLQGPRALEPLQTYPSASNRPPVNGNADSPKRNVRPSLLGPGPRGTGQHVVEIGAEPAPSSQQAALAQPASPPPLENDYRNPVEYQNPQLNPDAAVGVEAHVFTQFDTTFFGQPVPTEARQRSAVTVTPEEIDGLARMPKPIINEHSLNKMEQRLARARTVSTRQLAAYLDATWQAEKPQATPQPQAAPRATQAAADQGFFRRIFSK